MAPHSLHFMLRNQPHFEPLSMADADVLDTHAASYLRNHTDEAFKVRVENLAAEYLKGKPLFISSAALRGPFPTGWRNPWRTSEEAREADSASFQILEARKRPLTQEQLRRRARERGEASLLRRRKDQETRAEGNGKPATQPVEMKTISSSPIEARGQNEILQTSEFPEARMRGDSMLRNATCASGRQVTARRVPNVLANQDLASHSHQPAQISPVENPQIVATEPQSISVQQRNAKLAFKVSKPLASQVYSCAQEEFSNERNLNPRGSLTEEATTVTSSNKLKRGQEEFIFSRPGEIYTNAPLKLDGSTPVRQSSRAFDVDDEFKHLSVKQTTIPRENREDHPDMAPLDKVCVDCGNVNTHTQWRSGPDGNANLCNACGIYWKRHGNLRGNQTRVIVPKYFAPNPSTANDQQSKASGTITSTPAATAHSHLAVEATLSQPCLPVQTKEVVTLKKSNSFDNILSSRPLPKPHRQVMKRMFPLGVKQEAASFRPQSYSLVKMKAAHWQHLLTGPTSKSVMRSSPTLMGTEPALQDQSTSRNAESKKKDGRVKHKPKEKRRMIFETPDGPQLHKKGRIVTITDQRSRTTANTEISPNASLAVSPCISTQAAIVSAQEAFQKDLAPSPEKLLTSPKKRPYSSKFDALNERECNITPFRAFESEKFNDETGASLDTQELFQAYAGFNTAEKSNARSDELASSPSKAHSTKVSLHTGQTSKRVTIGESEFHDIEHDGASNSPTSRIDSRRKSIYKGARGSPAEKGNDSSAIVEQAVGFLEYWDVESELKQANL